MNIVYPKPTRRKNEKFYCYQICVCLLIAVFALALCGTFSTGGSGAGHDCRCCPAANAETGKFSILIAALQAQLDILKRLTQKRIYVFA
jgi:hypothetical protein